MADKIRGITIELNGDSTGLMKAIKGTNTELKKTQSALKDVNKLLKFDPGNTALLAQKQDYLRKAIDETSKKLEQEKKVLEELKGAGDTSDTTEQQRALERQIAETEQRLESLKNQAKEFGSVAAQQFKQAGEKLKEVGKNVQEVGTNLTKYVTTPLVAVGAASIAAFNEVDTGIDTIIQKTGASGEALDSMQKSMETIATTIPTGFDQAGAAVGEVNTRFGLMGDELTELSSKFIQFAELNGTDVSGSIDKVQSSMAAFGMDATEAGNVLDILNKAGQDTGISMDTLASALTANATTLQEAGFSFEQSAGFIANLNKNGLDSSAVMSGLQKAMKNATKEGKPLDKALADLQKSLKNAKSETEAMQLATELFGAKAGPQMVKALQEGRISLDASANSIENWGDSVETTFDATLDAPDKLKVTFNELKLVGADLGGTLLEMVVPALQKLSEIVHAAREAWNGLDEGQKQMIITIAAVVAAIGPVVTIIGTVITTVGTLSAGIGAVIGVLAGIAPAVGAAVVAFGPFIAAGAAIVAAGIAIYKNWDTIKEKADELNDAIKEKFEEIKTTVHDKWEEVKQKTSETWDAIKQKTSEAGKVMLTDVNKSLSDIQAAYESHGGGISGAAAAIMTAVEGAFTTGYDVLNTLTEGKFGEIVNTFNEKTGGLLTKAKEVWDGIKETVQTGIDKLKDIMNFEWELPKIKLPHFKISGEFSLNPPSVPTFGVEWYAKAMKNGMILNDPTIFGMMNGRLLGAGEAGSETVVGTQSLMNMIKSAVGETISYGDINITVYGAPGQDVEELADIISDRINAQVASRKAVFA
jgi:phage-related minor tail protein